LPEKDHTDKRPGKVYFVSDCHFGIPDRTSSRARERLFMDWLEESAKDAAAIYILGDLFDFWFEYRTVVQKGYTRLLGELARITDRGIPVHFFRGNHDVWAFSYLSDEAGLTIHDNQFVTEIEGRTFFLAHGDGLGRGDNGYKFVRKVFRSRVNQWLFRWLHPDLGTAMGLYWSGKSRLAHENKGIRDVNEKGIKRLTGYCHEVLKEKPGIDYFIFGHIHLPRITSLEPASSYVSLGDWMTHFSYAVFDGRTMELLHYPDKKPINPDKL